METTIEIAELRSLSDRLFELLERRGVNQIAVGTDHFWQVFFEDAFDLNTTPTPVVGSISDCLSDLREEMANPQDLIEWHALHHLSGVLSALAKASLDR